MLFGGNDTLKAGKTKEVLAVEKIRLLEKSSGFYWFIFVAIRRDTMKAH
ncbi:MAG TPA: hypothetical protein PLU80_08020 [Acidobacteriota bacterium]|nr:hypothetical protein [Acidobacteriota bacterium]